MTIQPYEFLARYNIDGTVAGAYALHIEVENGRAREGDQIPIADTSDPAYAQFAADFSANVIAERDSLTEQVATLTSERDALTTDNQKLMVERDGLAADKQTLTAERDSLTADKQTLTDQVADLQAQLDVLLNPPVNPRHVAPFDFLALFTQAEQVAIFSSSDPTVLLARAQLQTIITYVDLDLASTVNFVGYLEQAGLIGVGRAAHVLAGEAPPAS